MSLTSFSFFAFLIASLILYYITGPKLQKYVLFASTMFFFIMASGSKALQLTLILAMIIVLTYGGARAIDAFQGRKRTICTVTIISLLVLNLFTLKYVYNLAELFNSAFRIGADVSWLKLAAPIGISYFTLSAIGYLMEVNWGNYPAEKNFCVVANFVSFFPQIISGPISRFGEMQAQFQKKQALNYDNIYYGCVRMIWGYFKKLVISDRIALVVQAVYGNYEERGGLAILFAMGCYAIQLYTDFSGCMDIVVGAARLYGVTLPENFQAPFFSQTISEFWRRWHITLGTWFKDYVMYPVLKTKTFVNMGKKLKKRYGKTAGKKIPSYLSILIVWFLIGLWHGGILYFFVASALIPCCYLIGGDFFEPQFKKLKALLHIKETNIVFRVFQSVRTTFLMCICWVFLCTESVSGGVKALTCIFTNLLQPVNIMALLAEAGIGMGKLALLTVCILVLFVVDFMIYKKISVTKWLSERFFLIRWVLLYAALLMILFYGMVGESSFIYFQF
ncbi:MAG: MBOAT family protein [Lachnospiraceae bacterium]|nr:MBOAT family protein [Lachnospiraceae bacterium]